MRKAVVALGLVTLVVAVYGGVSGHAFLDYDDGEYVSENAQVLGGLTADGVAWAFTTGHAANWHPVTWLSHMADVELFGPSPGAHHLVNVALHAANAVLLLLALEALTGAFWPSAFVAALFAVHPLNVQSVAWVAERKNVLSTLFWLLGLLAYAAYAKKPSKGRFALVAACLALGLMSKPMLVTFPLVLLVLDVWPLRRVSLEESPEDFLRRVRGLVVEKIPLFILVGISAVVTWAVQARGEATASAAVIPLSQRALNACVSYGRYLLDALWPSSLSFFYPHPAAIGMHVSVAAALISLSTFIAISLGLFFLRKKFPAFLAGWAWYVITLVPVIGLVQVGLQARADRYAYVPLVGIFVAAVWGAKALLERFAPRARGAAAVSLSLAVLLPLALRARAETAHWKDAFALYRRAIEVDPANWLAWNNLGNNFLMKGDAREALADFDASLAIKPDYSHALYNRGVALQRLGRLPEALAAYDKALGVDPGNADALVNAGNAFTGLGRAADAAGCYQRALQLRPDDPNALYGLVLALDTLGDRRSAFAALDRLQRVSPQLAAELRAPAAAPR